MKATLKQTIHQIQERKESISADPNEGPRD